MAMKEIFNLRPIMMESQQAPKCEYQDGKIKE
jgi:hypothetical protein